MEPVVQFFVSLLLSINSYVGNFGLSIILFTIFTKLILLPFSIPTVKSQKKMQSLQPKMKELRERFKGDAKGLQQAQMQLYKENNVNPLGGCLPYIVQLGVMIVLYQAFMKFLNGGEVNGVAIESNFLWLNLTKPDHLYILPILAGITQLFMSLMLLPGAEGHDVVSNTSKSIETQKENKKEEDQMEMAESMQKQMMFFLPAVTVFMALKFPSGLALYWVITTVFSIVQQWILSGPGGVGLYWNKVVTKLGMRSAATKSSKNTLTKSIAVEKKMVKKEGEMSPFAAALSGKKTSKTRANHGRRLKKKIRQK